MQVCDYGDFVDGQCSTATVTSPATETTTALAEDFGILFVFLWSANLTWWEMIIISTPASYRSELGQKWFLSKSATLKSISKIFYFSLTMLEKCKRKFDPLFAFTSSLVLMMVIHEYNHHNLILVIVISIISSPFHYLLVWFNMLLKTNDEVILCLQLSVSVMALYVFFLFIILIVTQMMMIYRLKMLKLQTT